jgi:hypothetical protein
MPTKAAAQAASAAQMKPRDSEARNERPSARESTNVLAVYIPRGNTRLQYAGS